MKVHGRCHCGRITFEGEVDPNTVAICHCSDCQSLTGSAYRANIQTPAANFVMHGGPPKIYVKTADSGTKRAHAFCPDCGTPIYSAAVIDRPTYSLRIGTIRERTALKPARQIWCKSALSWSSDLGGIPRNDRQ